MIGGHLAGVAKIGVADTRRAKLEPVDTALRGIPSLAVSRLTHRRGKVAHFRIDEHFLDCVLHQVGDLDVEEDIRSEEHTSELQSLMRISYAVFCLNKKQHKTDNT